MAIEDCISITTDDLRRFDAAAEFRNSMADIVVEPSASVFFVKVSRFLQNRSFTTGDVVTGLMHCTATLVEAIVCNARMIALDRTAQAGILRTIGHMLIARATHVEQGR
jgi:hypothetical protein